MSLQTEDSEIIYQVIRDVKPPSKIKEILMYFLIGFCGGIGVGVLIYVFKT